MPADLVLLAMGFDRARRTTGCRDELGVEYDPRGNAKATIEARPRKLIPAPSQPQGIRRRKQYAARDAYG
jgi:hypothetical protein